jgi:hypothetical protein
MSAIPLGEPYYSSDDLDRLEMMVARRMYEEGYGAHKTRRGSPRPGRRRPVRPTPVLGMLSSNAGTVGRDNHGDEGFSIHGRGIVRTASPSRLCERHGWPSGRARALSVVRVTITDAGAVGACG